MRQFLLDLRSPANVTAIALALTVVAVAVLIARRHKRWRWFALAMSVIALAGAAAWVWYETPRVKDVSREPEHAWMFQTALCLSDEVFVTQWRTNLPRAEPAGFGGASPVSIDDYLAHPNDWHRSPAYTRIYGSLWGNHPQARVVTWGRAGDPIRVVRVVDRYRPENHSHILEVHGTIKGHLADVSMLFVGNPKVSPCAEVSDSV